MQNFGICLLSQVPIRQSVSHCSEMISQLLFGDTFQVEERYQHWLKIRCSLDGYEGWVDQKQIHFISDNCFSEIEKENPCYYTSDILNELTVQNASVLRIGMGCRLPLFKEENCQLDDISIAFKGAFSETKKNDYTTDEIPSLANKFMGSPYLWGGKSIFGIDCSGFSQMMYKLCGFSLPRDAKDQAKLGDVINFFQEAMPFDLFFFDNDQGNIVHVGIYLGDGKIVHASGKVRIDTIDSQGIYDVQNAKYTHNLLLIKRLIF